MLLFSLFSHPTYLQEPTADGDVVDDLDLFADETEDDKKAAEEREAAKKDTKKAKESKSFSTLDWNTGSLWL